MKRKNLILYVVTLVIDVILITNAFGLEIYSEMEYNQNKLIINKINLEPKFIKTNIETVTQHKHFMVLSSNETSYTYNGLHPALGRTNDGTLLSAYYDSDFENIIWTFSTDNGLSFNEGLFWEGGGDYPAIKLWDKETFFGTFVTNYEDGNGGITYLFDTTDPPNFDTYRLRFWDWSSYGWHNMIAADIACDSSQNTYEWGISCYIISSSYSEGYTDGPTLIYSDKEDEGSGWISWHSFNGCKHCDINIDPLTHMAYAVFDWNDTTDGIWKILLRKKDFSDIETGYDEIFTISGKGNLTNPAVAVYNNQIVILAETDENQNQDIICLHTDDGNPNNLIPSFVVGDIQDELYPDIITDFEGNFIATYVKSNNIFAVKSEDYGFTWSHITRSPINNNLNAVVEEYKTSNLCEYGTMVMWEEVVDNPEIWIGKLTLQSNSAPFKPIITGPNYLWRKLTKKFTISSVDPDGDSIYYFLDWGDGENSGWIGPFRSGEKVTISHTWDKKGIYSIRAKAKDILGEESEWNELEVSIPRYKVHFKSFIFRFFEQFPILQRLLLLIQ